MHIDDAVDDIAVEMAGDAETPLARTVALPAGVPLWLLPALPAIKRLLVKYGLPFAKSSLETLRGKVEAMNRPLVKALLLTAIDAMLATLDDVKIEAVLQAA